jgi:hypothetical protein
MIIGFGNETLYHHHSTKDQWNKKIKTWNHFCMLSLEHFQPRWFVLFRFLIKVFVKFIILTFSSSQNIVVFVLSTSTTGFLNLVLFILNNACYLQSLACIWTLSFLYSSFNKTNLVSYTLI